MVDNFKKHGCRSLLIFCLFCCLLFSLPIPSSMFCLSQDNFADTGMSYRIPGEVEPDKINFNNKSGLSIALFSPGELMLTDPQGRRTGLDPLTNTSYDEIPQANYVIYAREDAGSGEVASDPMKKIYIFQPITGEYTLKVTGTGEGKYALEIDTSDIESNPSNVLFTDMPISSGSVHSYRLDYDKTVGAKFGIFGSYNGNGQEGGDVNKFLTYSNPTESRTTLPAGTTTYPLILFYADTAIHSSFKAELNGVDISSMFSPTIWKRTYKGIDITSSFPTTVCKSEAVIIDLQAGKNVLLLSIDGDGNATDKDMLVFFVQ